MTTVPPDAPAAQRLRFLDLFSGIGGFALPLTEIGHACVGNCEIDPHASAVYRRHFPSHRAYGDVTRIDAAALPDVDLIVGGFPCQAFSVAGKRGGFADTRGTLFFDVCRIAREKRPRLLLLENVKGLLSHAGGKTFGTILGALDDVGYDADWQVCNSRDFGVPQNRERVYLVGHLRGTPAPEVFPLGEGDGEADETGPDQLGDCARTVTASPQNRNLRGSYVAGVVDHGEFRETDDRAQCIDANYWKGPDNHGARTIIAYPGHAVNEADGVARTLKAGTHGVPGGEGLVRVSGTIRRLTPVECERLQGYPDCWTEIGIDETGKEYRLSDTQRYKCCGNAVTTNVVRAIVRRLGGAKCKTDG